MVLNHHIIISFKNIYAFITIFFGFITDNEEFDKSNQNVRFDVGNFFFLYLVISTTITLF